MRSSLAFCMREGDSPIAEGRNDLNRPPLGLRLTRPRQSNYGAAAANLKAARPEPGGSPLGYA
jgi:hypothetical protein